LDWQSIDLMTFAASGNTEKIEYLTVYWSAWDRDAAEMPTIAVLAPSEPRAGERERIPVPESLLEPFPCDCGHVWRVFRMARSCGREVVLRPDQLTRGEKRSCGDCSVEYRLRALFTTIGRGTTETYFG